MRKMDRGQNSDKLKCCSYPRWEFFCPVEHTGGMLKLVVALSRRWLFCLCTTRVTVTNSQCSTVGKRPTVGFIYLSWVLREQQLMSQRHCSQLRAALYIPWIAKHVFDLFGV